MLAATPRLLCLPRRAVVQARAGLHATAATRLRSIVTLRDTKVHSGDEPPLTLHLALPEALGGPGDGTNPEQLFAMGYASCFLGALQLVASCLGKRGAVKNAVIRTYVHLGEAAGIGGFGIAVDIKVEGVEDERVIQADHEPCVKVKVSKA